MKLKRTTGLVLSLSLLMIPATAALAKPVASHHLDMTWSDSAGGVTVIGGFDLSVDDAGVTTVDLLETELRAETCDNGSSGMRRNSLRFSGEAALETVIDRQLKGIEVRGTLQVERTVTSPCEGTTVSSETIDLSLTGVSIERPVRTRDRANGVRHISRAHQLVLELGDASVSSIEMLTKSISSA